MTLRLGVAGSTLIVPMSLTQSSLTRARVLLLEQDRLRAKGCNVFSEFVRWLSRFHSRKSFILAVRSLPMLAYRRLSPKQAIRKNTGCSNLTARVIFR